MNAEARIPRPGPQLFKSGSRQGVILTPFPEHEAAAGTRAAGRDSRARTQLADGRYRSRRVLRVLESDRDLIDTIQNQYYSGTFTDIAKYDYGYDTVGSRNALELSGTAFTTHNFEFGYNTRSELETADRWQGTAQTTRTSSPNEWDFDYDNIGNRDWFKLDGDATGTVYTANDLNQYEAVTPQGGSQEYLCYDADGNLVQDAKSTSACGTDNGLFKYAWDAENRLIEIAPVSPSDGDIKLVFDYDYMSRRVRKRAVEWDETLNNNEGDWKTTPNTDQKFIYDAWNVVMVLDGNDSNDIDRKYTWGLDLSGLQSRDRQGAVSGIHGAGGIGGLLSAWDDTSGSARLYWYFYDGNGNVVQVLEYDDSSDTLNTTPVAHYEYDPYGNIINDLSSYSYAEDNPFRFSTKWLDDELAEASQSGAVGEEGLYYYGYRYYSPTMGRWMSRDPIEEDDCSNVYNFLSNSALARIDWLGLTEKKVCPQSGEPCKNVKWNPDDRAQTVCDGSGGVVICIRGGSSSGGCNPDDPDPIAACLCQHEEVHVDDSYTISGLTCTDPKTGAPYPGGRGQSVHLPGDPLEIHKAQCFKAWTEFRAHEAECGCLRNARYDAATAGNIELMKRIHARMVYACRLAKKWQVTLRNYCGGGWWPWDRPNPNPK